VLTGFNTDVEFEGVTYHVQTEDRAGSAQVIESLVYVRGEILSARRMSYQNLIEGGADSAAIRSFMEKQHFAIVEAIRRGRLELLTGPETAEESDTTVSRSPEFLSSRAEVRLPRSQRSLDEVISEWLAEQEKNERVRLRVEGGDDIRFGAPFSLRVRVSASPSERPLSRANVVVRFLSTETKPQQLAQGATDDAGSVLIAGAIPGIVRGTGLVVVSAQYEGGADEVKFLVKR
jgi:hypothetical protein